MKAKYENCKEQNTKLKNIFQKKEILLKQELDNKELMFMQLTKKEKECDEIQKKIDDLKKNKTSTKNEININKENNIINNDIKKNNENKIENNINNESNFISNVRKINPDTEKNVIEVKENYNNIINDEEKDNNENYDNINYINEENIKCDGDIENAVVKIK